MPSTPSLPRRTAPHNATALATNVSSKNIMALILLRSRRTCTTRGSLLKANADTTSRCNADDTNKGFGSIFPTTSPLFLSPLPAPASPRPIFCRTVFLPGFAKAKTWSTLRSSIPDLASESDETDGRAETVASY